MGRSAEGVPAKSRGPNAVSCYAAATANRVRAIMDQGLDRIVRNHDPAAVVEREFLDWAKKGQGTEFLLWIEEKMAARIAAAGQGAGINSSDIKGLMVAAMKQVGDGAPGDIVTVEARVVEASGVQAGYSDAEPVDW